MRRMEEQLHNAEDEHVHQASYLERDVQQLRERLDRHLGSSWDGARSRSFASSHGPGRRNGPQRVNGGKRRFVRHDSGSGSFYELVKVQIPETYSYSYTPELSSSFDADPRFSSSDKGSSSSTDNYINDFAEFDEGRLHGNYNTDFADFDSDRTDPNYKVDCPKFSSDDVLTCCAE